MTGQRLFTCPHPGLPIRFARSGCFAFWLVMLAGCGLAEVEHARMETGDVARQVSALRSTQAGSRLSTVRLIERRPYVGLTRIEPDPQADLPARFRRVDAVTLPLAGIGAAAVLAARIEAATGLAVRFTGPPRRANDTTGGDPPVHLLGEAGREKLSPDGGIWTGPLDALLDAWTEPPGYEWRYVADRQGSRSCAAVPRSFIFMRWPARSATRCRPRPRTVRPVMTAAATSPAKRFRPRRTTTRGRRSRAS